MKKKDYQVELYVDGQRMMELEHVENLTLYAEMEDNTAFAAMGMFSPLTFARMLEKIEGRLAPQIFEVALSLFLKQRKQGEAKRDADFGAAIRQGMEDGLAAQIDEDIKSFAEQFEARMNALAKKGSGHNE